MGQFTPSAAYLELLEERPRDDFQLQKNLVSSTVQGSGSFQKQESERLLNQSRVFSLTEWVKVCVVLCSEHFPSVLLGNLFATHSYSHICCRETECSCGVFIAAVSCKEKHCQRGSSQVYKFAQCAERRDKGHHSVIQKKRKAKQQKNNTAKSNVLLYAHLSNQCVLMTEEVLKDNLRIRL